MDLFVKFMKFVYFEKVASESTIEELQLQKNML